MKSLVLLLAIASGSLLPCFSEGAIVIRYFIMTMLFFAFLDVELKRENFPLTIFGVVLANIAIGFSTYFVLCSMASNLALAGFIIGITPTATAAPVIIGFLNRKAEYAIGSVILTNTIIALILPLTLPHLMGESLSIPTRTILYSILTTIFAPLIVALIVHKIKPLYRLAVQGKPISFYLWALCIFFACARSSKFIMEQNVALLMLIKIATLSLIICIINFGLGYLIGGREYKREASQSLGQKNTMFTMWVALNFISPLVALAPIFYLIYHNIYNSWQIHHSIKKQHRSE